MVVAGEHLQRFCQSHKAHAEGSLTQHLLHQIVVAQAVRINPDSLSHEEGIVIGPAAALNLHSLAQLAGCQR